LKIESPAIWPGFFLVLDLPELFGDREELRGSRAKPESAAKIRPAIVQGRLTAGRLFLSNRTGLTSLGAIAGLESDPSQVAPDPVFARLRRTEGRPILL
jgi:hypothetical protein